MKTDKEYIIEATKVMPDGDLDDLVAYAKATKARDALAEGKPSEETGESEEAPPEMSEAPAAAVVEAAAPAADATPLAEDVASIAEDTTTELMADTASDAALIQGLAELTGMDSAALLAVLQEYPEQVAAAFQGAAPSGTAADTAAMMSDAAQERIRALSVSVTKRDAEIKRLTETVGKLELGARASRIDAAIEAGHLLPTAREKYLRLDEETLTLFLSDAESSPQVPTTQIAPTPPDGRPSEDDDGRDLPPSLLSRYRASHSGLKMSAEAREKAAVKACRAFVEANPNDPALREQPRV